jgi:UDP-3-O-[3-hydroxymyristoyl] glucosamine N-acyltransferase
MYQTLFHKKVGPFSLSYISEIIDIDAEIIGDSSAKIYGVNTLQKANNNELSFLHNSKYSKILRESKANACILNSEYRKYAPLGMNLIVTNEPYLMYAKVVSLFYPNSNKESSISKHARISDTAKIESNCTILDGAVIGDNVHLGKNVHIGYNSVIGNNVRIGGGTNIGSNVTIIYSVIGNDCIIHAGVRMGQDGFGFTANGSKIKQVGLVKIGNNVEIGANSCIDRGALDDTVIMDNCKLDNLVQIGHNVEIGNNVVIAAQTGISGSTKVGNNVMLGGQTGIAGHLEIGDKSMAAGKSGIVNDIKSGEIVAGYPAIKIKDWHRQNIFLKKQSHKKY